MPRIDKLLEQVGILINLYYYFIENHFAWITDQRYNCESDESRNRLTD